MGSAKENIFKFIFSRCEYNHYGGNFTRIFKNYCQKSHRILKMNNFGDFDFGKMGRQIFKLYRERWPKFEKVLVSKKVPAPRTLHGTLELLAFDE
jgi:hypothetical protein